GGPQTRFFKKRQKGPANLVHTRGSGVRGGLRRQTRNPAPGVAGSLTERRQLMASSFKNELRAAIPNIPDYTKPGIMFRDITTLLGDARAFRRALDELVQPWAGMKIDKVAGIEARGFILGGAVAHQVSAGFIPIRKKGKLPYKRVTIGYSLEYGI